MCEALFIEVAAVHFAHSKTQQGREFLKRLSAATPCNAVVTLSHCSQLGKKQTLALYVGGVEAVEIAQLQSRVGAMNHQAGWV